MSKAFQLKGLREKRGGIKSQIEAIGTKLKTEARAMTADEKAAFDKLKTDWVAVNESIRTAEADITALDELVGAAGSDEGAAEVEQQNSKRHPGREDRDGRPAKKPAGDGAELARGREDRALAFQAWGRRQHGLPLTERHVAACKRTGINPRSREFQVRIGQPGRTLLKRTLSVGTATAGGNTVAPDFSYAMEKALVDYSNVRGVSDQFTTDTGVDLPYPTEDDTGNTGAQISENTEVSFADDTFGTVTFKGFKFTSKGMLISHELLNDSAFDLESHLGEQAGIRIGRITGSKYTTGSGTGEPHGVVTVSTLGLTAAGAAAFTADELTRLAFSVDRAYRSDPSCGYMMHDSILAYALLLKDAENRPLLRDSYRDGIAIPMLNGFPVHTNQFMASANPTGGVPITASKHVLFGAFSKHKIRDIGTVRLRRLDERYAEKDQVGFVAFFRTDSRCVNTAAIKHLLQA